MHGSAVKKWLQKQVEEMNMELIELQSVANKMQSFDLISNKIGISPDNARQRFSRCMDKLLRAIKNYQSLKAEKQSSLVNL